MAPELPGITRDEEIKRLARVLELVQMIAAAPDRYSRKDLADRFEISERMITKDLSVIRHGLKLDLRHTDRGYRFGRTPTLPTLQYNFQEALALLSAVLVAQKIAGAGNPDLAAAVARLEALFPEDFIPLLRQVYRPAPTSAHGEHRQQMLALLNRALLAGRVVEMTYVTASRGGETTERRVRPYALMPYERSWQLVAFCETRRAELMFKLDRIQRARILDTPYVVPESFSLERYMGNAWGIMRSETAEPEDVQLRFSPVAGRWISEDDWHPSQEIDQLADGYVLFRVCIPITPEFISWVLKYGSQVEVLAPAHLRGAVSCEHQAAADLNQQTSD